ncbi:uncharacterized protein LY89DRAFT_394604 [Mollisia scopiformis]|uniref:Zn(2)-C6 fungal-type domain-containing protein n=1 Tax=Mollisia scopiformis TaxID=149040 RepID=A0A194XPK9_MOLSC|nr:uncharacterized protein LY89DRAFT_394604 [Mollisia scopiformis]KUJ22123.1 hypothetical protein LY89DRAFT_394604 [Mollisia scopiformis]
MPNHDSIAHLQQTAPTVCEPCKRRKKSCNKALPACGRCSRLFVKCKYTLPLPETNNGSKSGPALPLPPLVQTHPSSSIDEQVSFQVSRLLSAITRKSEFYISTYFRTFHQSLPVVDQESFYSQLDSLDGKQGEEGEDYFGVLLLAIFLVAGQGGEEVYGAVKSIWCLLTGAGRVGLGLVRMGCLVAGWEFVQGMLGEAWGTVGGTVRMAQVLGLHGTVRRVGGEGDGVEEKRCVWWCVVVLERIINQEFRGSGLPFASKGPEPDDYLPLVPLKDGVTYRVRDEIVLPEDVDLENLDLADRGCTRFGPFAAVVQMTYLTDLTTKHILDESKSPEERVADAAKLDIALQHFSGACIPPPGKAEGKYCGPYGLRTSAAYSLHLHELAMSTQSNDKEGILRATSALQSLTRIIIYATKASFEGVPMDLDGIAFWAHRICAVAALIHIQFGERNEAWEADLEVLKKYLRYYVPKYRLYANYLKEIEAAEKSAMIS